MLMDRVHELMHDDIIPQSFRKPHQLYIETDRIPLAAAPPSGFLVPYAHALVAESELFGEHPHSLRQEYSRFHAELAKPGFGERDESLHAGFLFLDPGSIFRDEGANLLLGKTLRRAHNYLSSRLYTEAHTAEPGDADEGKLGHKKF